MAFIREAWYCAGFTNVLKAGEPKVRSGQQEMIENLVAESVRLSR